MIMKMFRTFAVLFEFILGVCVGRDLFVKQQGDVLYSKGFNDAKEECQRQKDYQKQMFQLMLKDCK